MELFIFVKLGSFWRKKSFFLRGKIFAYKMDRESSIDIDEESDFLIAEYYAKKYRSVGDANY